ncbi:hypothetical protein GC173_11375 [bacterium]|nr:hypothetical protein [bacterium]
MQIPGVVPPFCEIAQVERVAVTPSRSAVLLGCVLQPLGTKVNLRLFMPYVGMGRGLVALPRVGDEVLAFFPGGDLDMGIAMWGMYNGVDTVPDGEAADVVLFEGRDGDSGVIHLRGHLRVEVDESETRIVHGPRATRVGKDDTLIVDGSVQVTIAKDATVNVTGNVVLGVTGNVTATVTGATTVTATGAVSITAQATLSITAAGAITITAPSILLN